MKTKINKIIRRIAVFFAVFFAAGLFNISANAQQAGVMTEASADVYTQASGTYNSFGRIHNLSRTLIEIAADNGNNGLNDLFRTNQADGVSGLVADSTPSSAGLPMFAGEEIDAGDLLEIRGHQLPTSGSYRVYRRASDNAFVLATLTGETKAAADLVSGEFYLDDNWAETTDIAEAMGITPVICADGFTSDDMVICRAIDAADCGQNGRPDFWDGSMCVASCPNNLPNIGTDGTTCIAATTPTLICDAASTTGQNGDECTCRDGYTQRISPEMCAMPQTGNNNPSTGNNPQTSGGDSESKAAKVIGVVGIGMAIYVIANGGLFSDSFAFSPDFGYDITESGYAINGGGKISYSAENLQMQWSANQTNANGDFGDFRYLSKAEYKTDLFAATFSESVSGETADYNFALSANLQNGIWKISPVYRLHSEYDKGETETNNSLNLEGILRYNGWTINPSAGFRWENADGFADNARFRINAIHRF